MSAWYNERDPYAAQWLRNLISAGLIAPGVVDERSIEDVGPAELSGYAQCHFFAGIGVWSAALRAAGWPDDRPVWTGSCPCQPFSAAGKGAGFDDERHLWPAWLHLISQRRPEIVLGEQVASRDGLGWLDLVCADMEGAGYAIGAADLCAAGVGAPHIRQRLWFGAARLADADEQQRNGSGDAGPGRRGEPSNLGATGGVENPELPEGERQRFDSRESVREQEAMRHAGGSLVGGLVESGADSGVLSRADEPGFLEHAAGDGRIERRAEPGGRGLAGGRGVGWLADAAVSRRDEAREYERGPSPLSARSSEHGGMVRPAGPTNGFWRNADWLLCRDGKWGPVEPGTFPLAHGVAQRVGRLRAYGNAINKEAAETFIRAFAAASIRAVV